MSSLGVFEVDLWIMGKKFTHNVNMINELNENIISIGFIHAHKLTYDVIARQVKFASASANLIAALKQTVLPAMTSTVIKAKYTGKAEPGATYIANICTPSTPMISVMPSIVSVDENNICNINIKNCAPYDIMLERDNILGIMEIEKEDLIPLTDDFISSVCQDIHDCFPKLKKKRLSRQHNQKSPRGIQRDIYQHSLQAPGCSQY
jgi:hypothetical protein